MDELIIVFCFHRWRHPLSFLLLSDESQHYDSQDQGFHPYRSQHNHQCRVGVCVCVCLAVPLWNVCNSIFFFRDLLKSDTLLNCLYAGDHGGETPNPANHYQFDKVGWGYQRQFQPQKQASTIHLFKIFFSLALFASLIMWRNLAIPTCGFKVWEDCSFQGLFQRCVFSRNIIQVEHRFWHSLVSWEWALALSPECLQ